MYAPSSGGSDDGGTESTDSGATELVFEERMSAYKVRPQSAYPDTSRLALGDDDDGGHNSPEGKDAHADDRCAFVHDRQPTRRTACDNTHDDDTTRRRQLAPDRHDATTDGRKLLMRRGSRPRTATGVRTSGEKTESGPLRGLRIEGIASRGTEMGKQERKQRSSAPALLLRSRLVPVNISDAEQRGRRDANHVSGFGLPSCVPRGVKTADTSPTEPCHIACHTSRRSKQTSTPESDMLVVGSATARPGGRVWHPVTSRNPPRQLHRLHVANDASGFGRTPSMGQVAVLKLPPLEAVGVTHQRANRQKTVVKSGAKSSVPTPHQFLAG